MPTGVSVANSIISQYYGAKTFSDLILGLNPIAYWPLDEAPAGNAYLTFNGTNTVVNCGSGASLDDIPLTSDMTIDGWFKATAVTDSLFMKSTGSIGTVGYYAFVGAAGNVQFRIYDDGGTSVNSVSNINTLDGNWHHYACFFDISEQKVRVAIDGTWAVSASSALASTYSGDATLNFVIGDGYSKFEGLQGWCRFSNNDRYNGATPTNFTAPSRTTIPTVDANTISLWPMNEGYGSVAGDIGTNNNDGTISNGDWSAYPAAKCLVNSAQNGTYTGVTLANSQSPFVAPYFDGVNDFVNIYSAALNTSFDTDELTINQFILPYSSDFWTDGVGHTFVHISADGNNKVYMTKAGTNGRLECRYYGNVGGGAVDLVTVDGNSDTSWFMLSMTVSKTADELKFYKNGSQIGTTQTGLPTWQGALINTGCIIGAFATTPAFPHKGYLVHTTIFNTALSQPTLAQIYQWSGI